MRHWKLLNGRRTTIAATYRYPGGWTKHLNHYQLEPCQYGYHLCRDNGEALEWLNADTTKLWLAEPCPDHPLIEGDTKVVTCRTRLIEGWELPERDLRLFACDVAEEALRVAGVEDERSWRAIAVSRRYAAGEVTFRALAAAGAAARDAAEAAEDVAWDAAWDAAEAAAWNAARDAAWDAAWNAAEAAARTAARDAAEDVARTAARDAAEAAAWNAARDAARDAARQKHWNMFLDRIGANP